MHVKRVHRSRQELAVTASEICNYRQLTSSFQRVVKLASFGTQPETRKLQQVCRRLVTLLSSSRYQDAFASLAPA